MKKTLLFLSIAFSPAIGFSQNAIEAYYLSPQDLKGTARFMSMGGAFGALGGDLSTLSQNPGGIGVYRNSELGFTLDIDCQSSSAESQGLKINDSQTKFLLNNIGGVFTLKLPSATFPNLNVGFTYNKKASFNRRFRGNVPKLNNSLSNYIAAVTTQGGWPEEDIYDENYNLYQDDTAGPWLSILGYNAYLFNMESSPDGSERPYYMGQWEDGHTSGNAAFSVQESGGIDSYNIALGGNIGNVVFWGMDFDITHLNYTLTPSWTENLENAFVESNGQATAMPANWTLSNWYNCTGDGFNFKLGLIVKPIQELRLGFAFHTPTWYNLTETYLGAIGYDYDNGADVNTKYTNRGVDGYDNFGLRTPWKFIASIAGVIGNRLILSADYEWNGYNGMEFYVPSQGYYDGGWYDDYYYPWDPYYTRSSDFNYVSQAPYATQNKSIKNTFRSSNTFRVGAELRVTNRFSLRAGYCNVSSPVKSEARNMSMIMSGTIPSYRLDNSTNYITCGFGYRISKFYLDMAYVYKHLSSTFYAYSDFPAYNIKSPRVDVNFNNSQIVLTAGIKF